MLHRIARLVALGEATYYPTGTALISDWHRPTMRSRALSIHQTAVLAGTGFGAYAAGLIADRLGWRAPFVIFGAAGIVWCADSASRRCATRPRTRASSERRPKVAPRTAARRCAHGRPRCALRSVFFLGTGASTGVAVWAPTYVHDALGLDLADSALYGAATISIAGLSWPCRSVDCSPMARRAHADRPLLHTGDRARTRGHPVAAADGRALGDGDRPGAARIERSARALFDGCIYSSMHDVVPREARASAVGLMTMWGFIGAGLTPLFVAMAARVCGMAAGHHLAARAVLRRRDRPACHPQLPRDASSWRRARSRRPLSHECVAAGCAWC